MVPVAQAWYFSAAAAAPLRFHLGKSISLLAAPRSGRNSPGPFFPSIIRLK
jgi:hypothetical protein